MRSSLLPPTSLAQVLLIVAKLEDYEFNVIKDAITGPRSFELSASRREELALELGQTPESVGYLLSALGFLYRQLKPTPDEVAEFPQRLKSVLDDLRVSDREDVDADTLITRLGVLVGYAKNHEVYLKVARLEEGFIASLQSVGSFVDLRASFNATRTEIEGFVPIIQLSLFTDSPKETEAQTVVQLDTQSLAQLKAAIEDIDLKLNLLKTQSELFLPLLTLDEK